jgi:hypothetical protein
LQLRLFSSHPQIQPGLLAKRYPSRVVFGDFDRTVLATQNVSMPVTRTIYHWFNSINLLNSLTSEVIK